MFLAHTSEMDLESHRVLPVVCSVPKWMLLEYEKPGLRNLLHTRLFANLACLQIGFESVLAWLTQRHTRLAARVRHQQLSPVLARLHVELMCHLAKVQTTCDAW